ncbi:MAG: hypothetical protein HY296_07735 [Thaumarchaeota archaeon]|nr:hypothetical protein [Nitrososphaerota archaeon]
MSTNIQDSPKAQVAEYGKYGKKFEKALETVLAGGVKEAFFLPSRRKIHSVVGTLGDEFIDPDKPYCSCSHFYFKVRSGRDELCYHLLSYKIAMKTGRVETTKFSDEDYGPYFRALASDIFDVLDKSSGS